MKQRVISGVIIAAAIIGLGAAGSYPLAAAMMICSILAYLELTAVMCAPSRSRNSEKGVKGGPGLPDLIAVPGLLLGILYYAGLMVIEWRYGLVNIPGMIAASDFWTLLAVTADFLFSMCIYVYTFPVRKSSQAAGAVLSFLYTFPMMGFVYRTRNLTHGFVLYLLIFICSWGSDTMAYVAGRLFGKHKMAPVLSPKKTVEGAVGGVAGAALIGAIYAAVIGQFMQSAGSKVLVYAMISAVGALVSMTGDLAASAIKRNHDIKDYGNLIPGHGGILDRFDSVIITAPIIYMLAYAAGG